MSERTIRNEPVVRISQRFFEPTLLLSVSTRLQEGRETLEPALSALRGLRHYYVTVDATSSSMINVSVWDRSRRRNRWIRCLKCWRSATHSSRWA